MTDRDTYDIREYEREKTLPGATDEAYAAREHAQIQASSDRSPAREYGGTGQPPKILESLNVQPRMLAQLLAQSEPCLFANKSPLAVEPYELPGSLAVAYAAMCEVAREHAQIQVSFNRSLAREELSI